MIAITRKSTVSATTVPIPKTVRQSPALRMHCPHSSTAATAGKAATCPRLGSTHELLTHLQRAHRTTLTQYYCSLGDRLTVRFAERSICALAIPKNEQLELFLVLQRPAVADDDGAAAGKRTNTCWVWYVGGGEMAAAYRVRLECGEHNKWRGAVRSLDDGAGVGQTDVWQSEGCARIEAATASVVVEIT